MRQERNTTARRLIDEEMVRRDSVDLYGRRSVPRDVSSMTTYDLNGKFATEVRRIKQAAVVHRARMRVVLAVLLAAGTGVGLMTWFLQRPMNRDAIHCMAALGLGAATFCLGGIVIRIFGSPPPAACPQCGCDWRAASETNLDEWLAWRFCPICGLSMNCDNLSRKGL